jgi:hypothetical protein
LGTGFFVGFGTGFLTGFFVTCGFGAVFLLTGGVTGVDVADASVGCAAASAVVISGVGVAESEERAESEAGSVVVPQAVARANAATSATRARYRGMRASGG